MDVFLWGGEFHVGGPLTVLDKLRSQIDVLVSRIPITLLDLALAAGEADVRQFVQAAAQHIEHRYEAEMASAWLRDLLAGEIKLAIRRSLAAMGSNRELVSEARHIAIVERDGCFIADLPRPILAAFSNTDGSDQLSAQIREVGERIGVELALNTLPPRGVKEFGPTNPKVGESSVRYIHEPAPTSRPEATASLQRERSPSSSASPNPDQLRLDAAELLSKHFGLRLTKHRRSWFETADHAVRAIVTVSKRYDREHQHYWYALYDAQLEFLRGGQKGWLVLCAIDTGRIWAIPTEVVSTAIEAINKTVRPKGQTYWHIAMKATSAGYVVTTARGPVDIAPFEISTSDRDV
ncbi:MAG: hypothetical protein QM681_05005 [Novosphingobium sp.]